MQEDRAPKVFISYSWSCQQSVKDLAERLVSQGVDVVLDLWYLKEGQDKYAFMEQSVNDPEITKVLIICDEAYARKANNRIGGVGDETVIISPELYGNMKQEKFIPVIMEKDENGKPYVPAYIKSRIYIDLSEEERYEEEYEKLLRNIYEKPLYRKPALGKRPDWLDEENINLFPLTDLIKQMRGASSEKKQRSLISRFLDEYVSTVKTFVVNVDTPEGVYKQFVAMKEVRDVFLDLLPILAETELSFADTICDVFENFYNTWIDSNQYPDGLSDEESEIALIHIWELFVCVIAYLRHTKDYASIHSILMHTYFLRRDQYNNTIKIRNYCAFRVYPFALEERYKPNTEFKRHHTLMGDELCKRREKLPIYTKQNLAGTDLFLYQVFSGLDMTLGDEPRLDAYWFPTCYIYAHGSLEEWIKMKSKQYCERYMFSLFGVHSIDQLKERLSKCIFDEKMRYNRCFDSAPAILNSISLDEIGSVN